MLDTVSVMQSFLIALCGTILFIIIIINDFHPSFTIVDILLWLSECPEPILFLLYCYFGVIFYVGACCSCSKNIVFVIVLHSPVFIL